MRFLMTTKGGSDMTPPSEEVFAEMGAFVEETTRAGVLLASGGLDPVGINVSASDGEVTVTDGRFGEAAIVNFALIEVGSTEEALELSRRFWKILGSGEGSIQQVFGPED